MQGGWSLDGPSLCAQGPVNERVEGVSTEMLCTLAPEAAEAEERLSHTNSSDTDTATDSDGDTHVTTLADVLGRGGQHHRHQVACSVVDRLEATTQLVQFVPTLLKSIAFFNVVCFDFHDKCIESPGSGFNALILGLCELVPCLSGGMPARWSHSATKQNQGKRHHPGKHSRLSVGIASQCSYFAMACARISLGSSTGPASCSSKRSALRLDCALLGNECSTINDYVHTVFCFKNKRVSA